MKSPLLYFVLPCYNEEQCLKITYAELNKKFEELLSSRRIHRKSKIVFVDDGSNDATWQIITKLRKNNKNIVGLKLAHNVGHQNALMAGLLYAGERADYSISMDADLQDDLSVVDGFLNKADEGYKIVYGVRSDRKNDSKFKRWTAQMFYKMMHLLGVELVYNSADCRLMSSEAMKELGNYPEVNLFLRGIIPLIGLESTTIEYSRNKRIAGKSKYSLRKMLNFAWDGVTSFSIKPIRLVISLGVIIFIISLVAMLCVLIRWALGWIADGWAFLICSIWLTAGIQMISIGLIGEYVGKIYAEAKRRPRYFIETIIGDNENEK